MRPHERWIWVEPIGSDVEQPDRGVGEYLDTCGFTPHTICLLMTSPDFVLSHEDFEDEVDLPPDFCARNGHEFGRDRQRQVWTNRQLQELVANLQAQRPPRSLYGLPRIGRRGGDQPDGAAERRYAVR